MSYKPDHDVQFFQLDINGVVVLDEEHLHFVLQDFIPLLHDEIDVAQRHVLNFRFGRQQRHQRRRQLLLKVYHEVRGLVQHLNVFHEDLRKENVKVRGDIGVN